MSTHDRRQYYKDFSRGSINGGTATARSLRELGSDVLGAAKKALAEGAEAVADDARTRCPVKTGALRDSIKAVSRSGGTSYRIEANARNDVGFAYGIIVEFSPKTGHPFLYPALDANVGNVKDKIVEAVRQACRSHRRSGR